MPARSPKRLINELKRNAIRPNWSPLTAFNLTKARRAQIKGTLFQQLWRAKAEARRYHGEHLTLRQWQNIFKHNVGSYGVISMSVKKMAQSDGSEHAMGRGSGLATNMMGESEDKMRKRTTPYAHMMWAPLERRLDMAVFRALFASSARQARQFVLHGWVKVNGRVCEHPNYMLNPGDMFSVDPEMVLVATGQPKGADPEEKKDSSFFAQSEAARKRKVEEKDAVAELTEAMEKAKLDTEAAVKAAAKAATKEPEADPKPTEEAAAGESSDAAEPTPEPRQRRDRGRNPYAKDPNNIIDKDKPYATPWRPKDYMAPFAFVPRYLEVNHAICHAVYLRHPVCKPGESEIPSPFNLETSRLAYGWFLRRG